MKQNHLDALYFSGTDPHMSEYLPDHWQVRKFLCGFTGSFGEIVVTQNEAVLWTDTRYFIQAEDQLKNSGYRLEKMRIPGAISPVEWLSRHLPRGGKLGTDPFSLPLATYRSFSQILGKTGIDIIFTPEVLDSIWSNRPPLPGMAVREMPADIAGESRSSKLQRISEVLKGKGASLTIITALDDLAWTFNLRGNDIDYNPLFLGYGITGCNETELFVCQGALDPSLMEKLTSEGMKIRDYDEFYGCLRALDNQSVCIDPMKVNTAALSAIPGSCHIVECRSIAASLKSVKNEVQISGYRDAMKKDGAAVTKLMYWITENVGKQEMTEYVIARKAAEFRSEQPGFIGESFAPIVGYGAHGAIVHLSVGESDALKVENRGILLIDTGGHYLNATTDITRTIAVGPVTAGQKRDFTLVLKGMIALSSALFPAGTKGGQLDILARQFLWQEGLNYGHGTGHGVGHCLNVHEGPASIRQDFNPVDIVPGMVFSNEPGIYRTGEYGIRIENVMVCREVKSTEFGLFLGFEELTLCPIDKRLIDRNLLTIHEKKWLNDYHRKVFSELAPIIDPQLVSYLKALCADL